MPLSWKRPALLKSVRVFFLGSDDFPLWQRRPRHAPWTPPWRRGVAGFRGRPDISPVGDRGRARVRRGPKGPGASGRDALECLARRPLALVFRALSSPLAPE